MHNMTFELLCILAYEQSVSQMGVKNANTKLYTIFWRTSQTIPTWPSKNLFHNSLFRMKRASTTSILSQNNKPCNGTNESVKIVILLYCVTPYFSMLNANNRRPLNAQNIYSPKVMLCMSCSEPCYYKKQVLFQFYSEQN